jgi:outer membrane protein TolC
MNVADRADLLQAQAASKQKQLQFQTDKELYRQASALLNSFRNVRGDVVDEDLEPIDPEVEKDLTKQIKRTAQRADIEARIQAAQAKKGAAAVIAETMKPEINLYGSVNLSGRSTVYNNTALQDAYSTKYPTYVGGLKLTIPLDTGLNSDLVEGAAAAASASDAIAWRARFDLDQEWLNLQKRYTDATSRLKMATELEKLQEEKLSNERRRFSNGRTTSFQVLQFEDHYSDARQMRLRILNEIVNIHAQSRLFNGETL